MAAAVELPGVPLEDVAQHAHGEALGRCSRVPRIRDETEGEIFAAAEEDAEGPPVVSTEAADEARVGDEASPAAAYEGRKGQRGRQRGQAEEDLGEKVVEVHRRSRPRRRPRELPACRLRRPKADATTGDLGEEALVVHGHGGRRLADGQGERRRRRRLTG